MNAAVSGATAPVAPVTPVPPSAQAGAGTQEPGGASSFSQVMKDVTAAPDAGGKPAKAALPRAAADAGEAAPRDDAQAVDFNAAQLQPKTPLPRATAADIEGEMTQAGAQAPDELPAQPAAAPAFVMPPWLAMMLPTDMSRPPAPCAATPVSLPADTAGAGTGFMIATQAPTQAADSAAGQPAGVHLSTAGAAATPVFTLTALPMPPGSQDTPAMASEAASLPVAGAAPLGNLPAMLAAPMGIEPAPAPVHQGHIASHPQSPAFAQDLAAEVKFLVRDGLQSAHLNLNPAELGPIRIELNISSQVADISFVAAHAATREGIEQSLPQLREMLSSQGMTLGHAGVAADTRGGRQEAAREAQAPARGKGHSDTEGSPASDVAGLTTVRVPRGMLDLYA